MSHANVSLGAHQGGVMEPSPFAIPAKKLAMWLFIISDAMTFAACLVAYGFTRNATPNWPTPFQSSTVINVALMTVIFVTSSLTMLIALRAAKSDDRAGVFRWMMITVVLGVAFCILHLREWSSLADEGMTLFKNPWGTGLFGSAFYSITGLSLLHVVGGIVAIIVVGLRYKSGRSNDVDVEVVGLYWQFVNLVWMFIVPFVYLLNLSR